MTPRERVLLLLEVTRRVADASSSPGRLARVILPAATGLSPEGVARALERHLETTASGPQLDSLLRSVAAAPRVHVVLSANVFVAGARALALALASSSSVRVRPSRREPEFARLLVGELEGAGLDIALVTSISVGAGEHVHAYGADATLSEIARSLPAGTAFWGHGSGIGVAASAGIAGDMEALAADIVAFDQRGCLSPRCVFVDGSAGEVTAFAAGLADVLLGLATTVPVGRVDEAERVAARRYREALSVAGEVFGGPGAWVGVDVSPRALVIPPPPRVVHVVRAGADAACRLLAPIASHVTCLGGRGALADALHEVAPRSRRASLGEMQRPPLDGPVDHRSAPRPTSGEPVAGE